MGPRGKGHRLIIQNTPPFGLFQIGNVFATQLAVPAKDCPKVGTLMGPIEESLRDKLFTALFEEEDISANSRKTLGHSIKRGGFGILGPRMSEDSTYNTSKADSGELVVSLLGGITLNYVGNRACVRRASASASKERKHVEMAELSRKKELVGV